MREIEIKVLGKVQGVGMRQLIKREAQKRDLVGYVENLDTGAVEIIAQGKEGQLEELIEVVRKGTIYSKIDEVKVISHNRPQDTFTEFEIWT